MSHKIKEWNEDFTSIQIEQMQLIKIPHKFRAQNFNMD
jgi:hypothetical protein